MHTGEWRRGKHKKKKLPAGHFISLALPISRLIPTHRGTEQIQNINQTSLDFCVSLLGMYRIAASAKQPFHCLRSPIVAEIAIPGRPSYTLECEGIFRHSSRPEKRSWLRDFSSTSLAPSMVIWLTRLDLRLTDDEGWLESESLIEMAPTQTSWHTQKWHCTQMTQVVK